jgi:SAM-dependent methyltransferase
MTVADEGGEGLRYPADYQEMASTGRAVHLVRTAGIAPGLVLDVGCGAGAVAEPLRDLGFEYVGLDVDPAGMAALGARGFEVHALDLAAPADRLSADLAAIVGERPLRAVLALDVLEHLVDPVAALRGLRACVMAAGGDEPAPLVVSIPNITHRDVAGKLLLGLWDVDSGGLLDDTHVRFFSELELERTLDAGGWSQEEAADVVAEISDQCFPDDAPSLRPGAPLRELLASVRGDASATATTYQFVRRLRVSERGPRPAPHHHIEDEALPRLGVVVLAGVDGDAASGDRLVADLEAQTRPVDVLVRLDPGADLVAAIRGLSTRMVAVLDTSVRLAPTWAAEVVDATDAEPGRVVQVPTVLTDGAPGGHDRWATDLPTDIETFDVLHVVAPRPAVPVASVVPVEVVRSAGVVPTPGPSLERSLCAWLVRVVQLSGRHDIGGPALLALPADRAVDAAAVQHVLVTTLDARPLLLPQGSAARIIDTRRRAERAERRQADLERRLSVAQDTLKGAVDQVHRAEGELSAVRPELEKLRAEHARKPSRRIVRLIRRVRRPPAPDVDAPSS